MPPLSFDVVQQALKDEVTAAVNQLPALQAPTKSVPVVWAQQGASLPPYPFVLLNFASMTQVFGVNPILRIFNPLSARGREIEHRVQSVFNLVFSVQGFSQQVVGDTSGYGMVARIRTAFDLDSVYHRLNNAGMKHWQSGPVINQTTLVKVAFESRAQFDAYFYVVDETSEFYAKLRRIAGTVIISGNSIAFDTNNPPLTP